MDGVQTSYYIMDGNEELTMTLAMTCCRAMRIRTFTMCLDVMSA